MHRSKHSRRHRGRRRRHAWESENGSEGVETREHIRSKERSKLEEEENKPRASMEQNDNFQQEEEQEQEEVEVEEEPKQDGLPQFEDPELRQGMHRKRAVYIKIRKITGFDLAYDYISRKMSPGDPEFADSVSRWGMHWAVEIGPWTIELGKDPETLKKPVVNVMHNNSLDASWENEVDRMKVGMSSLSDRQLSHPERFIGGHPETYDLAKNNCQIVASKISISLSDNPWEAFDTIYSARAGFSGMLDIKTILEYMIAFSKDGGSFFRWSSRALALGVRDGLARYEEQKLFLKYGLGPIVHNPGVEANEPSAPNPFVRNKSYEKWESRVLSLLR